MNRHDIWLCVLLLPVCSTLCRAGDARPQRDDAAIEKVVADSMEAARNEDWKRYAELVHPESLEDYKGMWLPALTAAAKAAPEKQADLLPYFDQAADLKSVIALKPKEFFVSSMKGMASSVRQEGIANPLKVDEKIIGTVYEGDHQAYVVVLTRRKFDGVEMTQVDVTALKRSGAEWKVMLSDSVRILAETFRRTGHNTIHIPLNERVGPGKEG